ncbi:hypothetical protein VNI00_011997 [Paramarasmius palmivorus]|uniref:Uncharacterized protein n=1 Tax=Paramarasmius palmivorus TaxID=297713 RepID=A0AAW0CBT3_9AGAR
METVTPGDIPLPAFLDPLLDYLSDNLPPPVYSFIISFASHCLAVASAFASLFAALLRTNPSQWDAQTILPPLIAFLTAYLALVSLYRTTTWMVRTGFWFVKWGTILAALFGGMGWVLGNGGNAVGGTGIMSGIGGLVLGMINGESSASTKRRQTRSSTSSRQKKPKAWDDFQTHREWQYQEDRGGASPETDAQVVIENIVAAARDSGFWNALSSAVWGSSQGDREERRGERRSTSR